MHISFFATATPLAASAFAQTHEYSAGRLHIEHPWVLVLPPTSPNGAAHFMAQNHGKENDTLFNADMPHMASVRMHEHVRKNGITSMQKTNSVDVAPDEDLRFVPDGYHLMLMGLKQPLVADERFPLMLHLHKAGGVPVEIVVESETSTEQGGHERYGH